jgi:hypothetical protein
MPKKSEKRTIMDLLADKLESSGFYKIEGNVKNQELKATDYSSEPEVNLLVPNFFSSVNDFTKRDRELRYAGQIVVPVFYADGSSSLVPLKGRGSKPTLKRHSFEERASMIHLRKNEKYVLNQSSHKSLDYILAGNNKLVTISFLPVMLNYDHLDPDEHKARFARNGYSEDYKIKYNQSEIGPAARANFSSNGIGKLVNAVKQAPYSFVENERAETAQNDFPGLSRSEAYAALMGKPL